MGNKLASRRFARCGVTVFALGNPTDRWVGTRTF
jgi:hypothetical protein